MEDHLSASAEDYLEAIAALNEQGGKVTVTAISKQLGVTKPSVTEALKRLANAGLVTHEKYGEIALTSEGPRIGWTTYRRHKAIRRFLVEILGIDPEVADRDACQVEHWLSPVTMDRLMMFLEYVTDKPNREPLSLGGLHQYFEHGEPGEE
jgi:DtxR family Mn-dependent transcriptional regulator